MRFFEITESRAPDPNDWGGVWILPDGSLQYVDHERGLHHQDIAHKTFKAEDAIDSLDQAYRHGWIRISTRGEQGLSVDFEEKPTAEAAKALFRYLDQDSAPYQTYEGKTPRDAFRFGMTRKEFIMMMRRGVR